MITSILIISLIAFVIIYFFHYQKWYTFSIILKYPYKKLNEKYIERKRKQENDIKFLRKIFMKAEEYLNNNYSWKYLSHSNYLKYRKQLTDIKDSYKKKWYYNVDKVFNEFNLCKTFTTELHFIEDHNKKFIDEEKERCKKEYWFLTDAQQTSIYTDEDAVLVNAGAWTWKTKVLENKIKYLVKEKWIDLKDILVITFSNNSQKDMTKRICDTLDKEWIKYDNKKLKYSITNFHKFWKRILEEYNNKSIINTTWKTIWIWNYNLVKVLEEEGKQKIINQALKMIQEDQEISSLIQKYFFYYSKTIPHEESEFYNNKKEKLLTFLKDKNWNNIQVKSYWEFIITNYLVEHWIKVKYEPENWFYENNETKEIKNYKPDFYLPDYDLYIEYFWVNKNNETAPWIDEDEYVENMNKKIEQHKASDNKLIIMKYADFTWWIDYFIKTFEKELNENWINTNIKVEIDHSISEEEITKLWKLLSWFHALYSESWLTEFNIKSKIEELPKRQVERARKFFEIFTAYNKKYKEILKSNNYIDFSDMINKATEYLKSWAVKREYKYVLIDEFQDTSMAKINMIKELTNDRTKTKLFCVWDDWQSIYRFAWSDLWIFLKFWESLNYKNYSDITLDKTYRFNEWISKISWDFIMTNESQTIKFLESENKETDNRFMIQSKIHNQEDSSYRAVIEDIIKDYINHLSEEEKKNNKHNITCLYLTRYNINKYQYTILDMLKKKQNPKQDKEWYLVYNFDNYNWNNFIFKLKPLTIHKSKWLQAEYTITDFVDSWYVNTFPSNIDDDPLLALCLKDWEYTYPYAEERRLFYVAITRCKKKNYLLYEEWRKSIFIRNIETLLKWWELSKDYKWPHCWECWWDLILKTWFLNEYCCKNWCEWRYFEFEWRMYKSPLCNCRKYHSILRTRTKNWVPIRGCENYPRCRKFHKFNKRKFCIWFTKK